MLLYTRRAAPKAPKRRSRAGCIHCKEKKKKCNEQRPQCDRCMDRGLQCEYEPVKPRKKRRASFAGSALSRDRGDASRIAQYNDCWNGRFDNADVFYNVPLPDDECSQSWEASTAYLYPDSDSSAAEWDMLKEVDSDVEEIIRAEPLAAPITSTALVYPPRRQYPDLSAIAPNNVTSPLLEFCAPVFEEFTDRTNRRALVDHFCNVLSHLIVFKEDTGNPFRQLVLPLSHSCSPIMNAIYALSSAHLEYKGVENEEKSLDFHNKALQGLAQLIEHNDTSNREEVLGAIMLLVYYEVLVQRNNSNIVTGHLKAAMTIMMSGPRITSPTTLFLERAFRFYDVIAALSLGIAPNTHTQPTAAPLPAPPNAFFLPNSPLQAVDTLLGLSTDLWPIIHRLSHLLSFKNALEAAIAAGETSKATVLRTELETASQAIEFALNNWRPTLTSIFPIPELDESFDQDPITQDPIEAIRMQSILNNAEAYRHSAFTYLYRTVRSQPRSHSLVQRHAHSSLVACSNVVELAEQCVDGPMSALLWPLFVASCEATTVQDRGLAMKGFCGIERRQGMNNIMRAWMVVQEVWKRADNGNEDVNWREICEELGFSIVFG